MTTIILDPSPVIRPEDVHNTEEKRVFRNFDVSV